MVKRISFHHKEIQDFIKGRYTPSEKDVSFIKALADIIYNTKNTNAKVKNFIKNSRNLNIFSALRTSAKIRADIFFRESDKIRKVIKLCIKVL